MRMINIILLSDYEKMHTLTGICKVLKKYCNIFILPCLIAIEIEQYPTRE